MEGETLQRVRGWTRERRAPGGADKHVVCRETGGRR